MRAEMTRQTPGVVSGSACVPAVFGGLCVLVKTVCRVQDTSLLSEAFAPGVDVGAVRVALRRAIPLMPARALRLNPVRSEHRECQLSYRLPK